MAVDLLANVERAPTDRPPRAADSNTNSVVGYWFGSAAGEVQRWKARALAAEALVAELRRGLAGWRWRP